MRASAAPPAAIISAAIGVIAKAMGIPQEQFLKFIENITLQRSSPLAEVANTAIFLASEASGKTGTVANLTRGMMSVVGR